jgi:cardiolipin synthase A/B
MDLSAPGIFALLAAVLGFVLATVLSGHAILNKQDTRATVAWVGVIWLAPIVGSLLYLLLGINRIHRRASQKRSGMVRRQGESDLVAFTPDALEQFVPDDMKPLSRLSSRVSRQPLLAGNRVEPLADGESFYPRMLAAIRGAQRSIGLSTYIFNRDPTGLEFADALAAAVKRGVEVRVLVDSVGLRYSIPSIERVLRRARVPMAQFMPTRMPWALPFMNLRNHRKILVVDGRSGFLVPERDVQALSATLDRLLRAPEEWGASTEAARRQVENHFDQDPLNDRLVEIYAAASAAIAVKSRGHAVC